ncbi:MAG: hypothetical protein WDN00_13760 [Limisphaerales bacterium]
MSEDIRRALEQSICLIVVCSPRSAQDLHVNEVVRYFKQLGRGANIFPIVVAGEPNASDGTKLAHRQKPNVLCRRCVTRCSQMERSI